ncbi:MAG: sulfoacetaldehyde acetyltransferase [Lautropia sp.]
MKHQISGSEALVEALRIEGVKNICGIVGSAFMDPLDLFPEAGIRFIQVRHEQSAALMAEGYARATGVPGVCIGQNGPGITNLVTGVASAYLNHTPLVVLTPAVLSSSIGTGAFQEVDQMRMLAPVVKWQLQVNRPDRMTEAIRGAFRAAVSLRGPVQVDIPRDAYYGVWEEEALEPSEYRGSGRYGGADRDSIAAAVATLKGARRIAILAGSGAVDANASDAIGELAEMLSAPVACVWLHNDAFRGSHPLAVGPIGYQGSEAAMRLVADSDVILALGTRLNAFGTTPQYGVDFFPRTAKLIHNSINPLELGALRRIEVGLLGDCREVTMQLIESLRGAELAVDHTTRRARIEQLKGEWSKKLEQMSHQQGDPIHPRRALWEVSRAVARLNADTTIVADVGNISGSANAYFDSFEQPRRWIAAGSLGGIGVGFPTALGVKLARPKAPVLALVGDGAWSMSLQEVMTAVREKLALVTVIFNNSVYGAERRNQYDFFGERYFYTDLENPSFAEIAREMGADGIRIDKPEEIAGAVTKALSGDRTTVIEIMTDSRILNEPYRRDALKMPVRVMDRYRQSAAPQSK